jgi:hypothetical protein
MRTVKQIRHYPGAFQSKSFESNVILEIFGLQNIKNLRDQLSDRGVIGYFLNVKTIIFYALVRKKILDVNDERQACYFIVEIIHD